MHILELHDEILLHVGAWLDHLDVCNLILSCAKFSRIYQDPIFLLKKINTLLKHSGQPTLPTHINYDAGTPLKLFHWLFGTWDGILGTYGVSSTDEGTLCNFQFNVETHQVVVDCFTRASHSAGYTAGFKHSSINFSSDNTGHIANAKFDDYRIECYPHLELRQPIEMGNNSIVPGESLRSVIKDFRHDEFKFDIFEEREALSISVDQYMITEMLKLKPIADSTDYSFPVPFDPGWFIARYSTHGLELVDVRYVQKGDNYFIIGTKLIGDPNVPCYQHTFCIEFDPFDQSSKNRKEPLLLVHQMVDYIDENKTHPKYFTSRYEGCGTIAHTGFKFAQWTKTALLLTSNESFYVEFSSLHHAMEFKRVAHSKTNCRDFTRWLQTEQAAVKIPDDEIESDEEIW